MLFTLSGDRMKFTLDSQVHGHVSWHLFMR